MEDKTPKSVLEWKVVGLGQSSGALKGTIPINAMKFGTVKKLLMDKSYRRDRVDELGARYMHPSIRGLYVYINEVEHSIRAQADGAAALSQAADDLNLPSYHSE